MPKQLMDYPSEENHCQADHAGLLINSYQTLLGKELIAGIAAEQDPARSLFQAPIAAISHGTDSDPIFNYANLIDADRQYRGQAACFFAWEFL
jgi:hypothetical protein